jgi:Fe-S-cluster containining protein
MGKYCEICKDKPCCKEMPVTLFKTEFEFLRKINPTFKYKQFGEKYYMLPPCPFIALDNKCGIYHTRPLACRQFPVGNFIATKTDKVLLPIRPGQKSAEFKTVIREEVVFGVYDVCPNGKFMIKQDRDDCITGLLSTNIQFSIKPPVQTQKQRSFEVKFRNAAMKTLPKKHTLVEFQRMPTALFAEIMKQSIAKLVGSK